MACMVFIFQEDAFDRLSQVEGEEWARTQNNAAPYDKYDAWVSLWKLFSTLPKYETFLEAVPANFKEKGEGVLYGAGGWNRWYLSASGEWMFLGYYANAKMKEKAILVGFTVL